jgi:hypothetical protein
LRNSSRPQLGIIIHISLSFKQLARRLHGCRLHGALLLAAAIVLRISWLSRNWRGVVSAVAE